MRGDGVRCTISGRSSSGILPPRSAPTGDLAFLRLIDLKKTPGTPDRGFPSCRTEGCLFPRFPLAPPLHHRSEWSTDAGTCRIRPRCLVTALGASKAGTPGPSARSAGLMGGPVYAAAISWRLVHGAGLYERLTGRVSSCILIGTVQFRTLRGKAP